MSTRYGIWSIKTKGWVYEQPSWADGRAITSTYKTKRAAAKAIKTDLVHEKDYVVKEYK